MGRLAEVNQATLLLLKTYNGNTSRGVQARVYNDAGTEQSGSPFTLTHAARGNYKSLSWTPNVQGFYYINYEVFTDGTFTTLDTTYTQLTELVLVRSTIQALRDGTAQAGAASTITLDAGASAVNDFYRGGVVQIVSGTGAGQSRSISSYVGSTKIATIDIPWATNPGSTSIFSIKPAGTSIVGDKTGYSLTLAEHTAIGVDVWDTSRTSHQVAGSFGLELQSARDGTAQTGTSTSITLDAGASAVNDFYRTQLLYIYTGTGVGQTRMISGYVGSTKVATIVPAWATTPDATSKFVVLQNTSPIVGSDDKVLVSADAHTAGETVAAVTAGVTVTTNNDKTGYSLIQTFPSNFSSLAINGSVQITVVTNVDKTNYTLIASEHTAIGADVWDIQRSSHQVAGSFGVSNQISRDGTAQTGTSTSITLDASASAVNDFYKNSIVFIMSGTGAGQSKLISSYVGSTKVVTIESTWATTPDNTSKFNIIPFGSIAYQILSTPTNLLLTNISGHVTPADTSITSAKFAADAIDSNALATSAVTEIVTAIFGKVIDVKTFAEVQEIILAYATGKIIRTGNSYEYEKQDNTTPLFTLISSPTDRTRTP